MNYNKQTLNYFEQIHRTDSRAFTFANSSYSEASQWQCAARTALEGLLMTVDVRNELLGWSSVVRLLSTEDMGAYLRYQLSIQTEPFVHIKFWMLKPKGKGPFPLMIVPHGHTHWGMNQTVGVYRDEKEKKKIERKEKDLALQAVARNLIAIAPVTRGFEPYAIPDLNRKHGGSSCRTQLTHCLIAGRTALGERIWDLQQILNWAIRKDFVNKDIVLAGGHSGGGVLAILMGALDTRIALVAASCSFCTFVGESGFFHFCDCNTIPGISKWGGFGDIAGLIAPRPLIAANGLHDLLYPPNEVKRAAKLTQSVYQAFGQEEQFQLYFGGGGNKVYADTIWKFIHQKIPEIPPVPVLQAPQSLQGVHQHSMPDRHWNVSLQAVDKDNVVQICRITSKPGQEAFVKENAISIAQSGFYDNVWCKAIYADETPVGLIMVREENMPGVFYLWRFMIGGAFQGKGFGKRGLQLLIDFLRKLPEAKELYLYYLDEPGHPARFYESVGFVPSATKEGKDRRMKLKL